ncbi:MAG: hypothetical protein ACWA5Q_03510 [bacterium]
MGLRALVLFLLLANQLASTAVANRTELGKGDEINYVIGVSDIPPVSLFFRGIPNTFNDHLGDFTAIVGQRKQSIVYYDSDDHDLLKNGLELSHVIDNNLPKYREERERILLTRKQNDTLSTTTYVARKYNKNLSKIDKHPLFRNIKRASRPEIFQTIVAASNSEPTQLKSILEIDNEESVIAISKYGKTVAEFILSYNKIENFGIPTNLIYLRLSINNHESSFLSENELTQLHKNLLVISQQIESQFPSIQKLNTVGLQEYLNLAIKQFPAREFFNTNPLLFTLGQILTQIFVFGLLIALLLGRYSPKLKSRLITRQPVSPSNE